MGPDRGHQMSVLLNEAITILTDERLRELYDIDLKETLWEHEQGFSGRPLSEWIPQTAPKCAKSADAAEARALFVDEHTCIGCKYCKWAAPDTFELEPTYGRARVVKQWIDPEDHMQAAVEACPVQCIHWVHRNELPVLEHVMQMHTQRMNVGVMKASAKQRPDVNVFHEAALFMQHESQRKRAHASWKKSYQYSQEQEEAMARAQAHGLTGFFRAAGLTMFGKLVAAIAVVSRALRANLGQPNLPSLQDVFKAPEAPHEDIPPERALVPIRISEEKQFCRR